MSRQRNVANRFVHLVGARRVEQMEYSRNGFESQMMTNQTWCCHIFRESLSAGRIPQGYR